jgi:hypothetical protein
LRGSSAGDEAIHSYLGWRCRGNEKAVISEMATPLSGLQKNQNSPLARIVADSFARRNEKPRPADKPSNQRIDLRIKSIIKSRLFICKEISAQGILPNFFSFNQAGDLIRLGGDHDGGYLVSASDIAQSNYLISLGIADDWRFEADFLKMRPVRITAYDGSISAAYF